MVSQTVTLNLHSQHFLHNFPKADLHGAILAYLCRMQPSYDTLPSCKLNPQHIEPTSWNLTFLRSLRNASQQGL